MINIFHDIIVIIIIIIIITHSLTYLLTDLLTTEPNQLSNLDMATAGKKRARWSSKKKGI